MNAKRAVIYTFKSHNKYNGTLFYCFEYFTKARELDPETIFYIHNISKEELEKIKTIFRDRYEIDESLLESIRFGNSIQDLYDLESMSNLILDIHTFDSVFYFLKGDIYCYSNYPHEMKRSEFKKIVYFGHYAYQNFDHEVKLKLNFSIFKKLTKSDPNRIFVSSRNENYKDFSLPEELAHLKPINKDKNLHHKNLFELFDTVYYYHSGIDTNNRLIPEAFFYNKKLHVQFNNLEKDSIFYRYEDILKNGLQSYTLDDNDLMLRMFLGLEK